ncbi:MAG: hypothetical protein K6T83_18400 [Alicyclobacillus sp.]|nr:hypothetical protein [Alicyclobacillus sp.]
MNANKWRNWALVYMFGGFFIIYCGVYSKALLPYLLGLGSIGVVAGILIYFRFGPVNPTMRTIECPRCSNKTRLTGPEDACDTCHLPLRRTEHGTYEPYVKETFPNPR